MKFLLPILAALAFTGCAAIERNPQTAERISARAGYRVATEILRGNPGAREAVAQTADALAELEAQPEFDLLAVTEVLRTLPDLDASRAGIILDGSDLIIFFAGDPALKPETHADLLVVVRGLRTGIERRLAQP